MAAVHIRIVAIRTSSRDGDNDRRPFFERHPRVEWFPDRMQTR
jgi:hypothetical protein